MSNIKVSKETTIGRLQVLYGRAQEAINYLNQNSSYPNTDANSVIISFLTQVRDGAHEYIQKLNDSSKTDLELAKIIDEANVRLNEIDEYISQWAEWFQSTGIRTSTTSNGPVAGNLINEIICALLPGKKWDGIHCVDK